MAANPTEGWHRYQSSQLRDVASNSAWLIAQTSGGFFEHVRETMNLPFSRAACQNCGIECPAEFELDPHDVGGLEIVRQDDLSALFGDAALSMATRRLVRCIWLWRGWPTRFAALCGGDAACERVVDEFKADLEAFRFVSDMRDKSNKVLDRLHRSPFTHVTVDQYVEAFLIMFIHSVFLAHRQ
jgi:ferredoxin